jgi:ABC-type transport system involved in multi-copper enzyme maturation permease subunit
VTAVAATRFTPAPSLSRLFAIELRKTIDTRAGFWLLVATALTTIGVAAITLAAHNHQPPTFGVLFQNTVGIGSTALPVLGILAITSEWSQRTAITTFALVPRRERVIVAKLLAGAALALAFVAVCLLTSVAATALVPVLVGGDAEWDIAASSVAAAVPYMVMWMLVGAALGLLVMSSAPAIVLSFLIPIGLAGLTAAFPAADDVLRWIDLGNTSGELIAAEPALSGADFAHVAAGFAILVLIPLALGFVRLHRREVTTA